MLYKNIQTKRIQYNISQSKLAKESKISPALISSWELGKKDIPIAQYEYITKVLDGIIDKIERKELVINKKYIKSTNKKSNQKKIITTKEEYIELMKNVTYQDNDYITILKELSRKINKKSDSNAPKAISLFSGCGGLDAGFKSAGFNIIGHVEIEESARKIYEANFPKSIELGTDVCEIKDEDIKSWITKFGQIDILIGGPPCQGFSLAGKRDPSDIRNQLYKEYVRIVAVLKPKVFIMENVKLITSMKEVDGNLFIDKIINSFEQIGYRVNIHQMNAQSYGVPQSRERIFIIGISKEYTHKIFNLPETNQKYRTFKDATKDLEELDSDEHSSDPLHWSIHHPKHVINWLKDVPEGHSAHDNEDIHNRPSSGFNTTYKRIKWDEPCSTISTTFNMISGSRNVHPKSTRSLTIREATRVQTFPDDFIFIGKWGEIRKAIGNSVPPILANFLAKEIKKQLFQK